MVYIAHMRAIHLHKSYVLLPGILYLATRMRPWAFFRGAQAA